MPQALAVPVRWSVWLDGRNSGRVKWYLLLRSIPGIPAVLIKSDWIPKGIPIRSIQGSRYWTPDWSKHNHDEPEVTWGFITQLGEKRIEEEDRSIGKNVRSQIQGEQ